MTYQDYRALSIKHFQSFTKFTPFNLLGAFIWYDLVFVAFTSDVIYYQCLHTTFKTWLCIHRQYLVHKFLQSYVY